MVKKKKREREWKGKFFFLKKKKKSLKVITSNNKYKPKILKSSTILFWIHNRGHMTNHVREMQVNTGVEFNWGTDQKQKLLRELVQLRTLLLMNFLVVSEQV